MPVRPPPRHGLLRGLLARAGQEALSRQGACRVRRKGDGTPVTDADTAAEQVLFEGLHRHFPDEEIVGEEGARATGSACTWYIDPIDGTASYLEGLAYWAVMVGRVDPEGPSVAAILFPRLGEFWFAERGLGAWRGGRRLPALEPRPVLASSVLYVPSRFHTLARIGIPCKLRNLGSTAAHLSLLAAGAAEGAIVASGWGPWDVAAPSCLLAEVGGCLLDPALRAPDISTPGSQPLLAGSPAAVESLLVAGVLSGIAR